MEEALINLLLADAAVTALVGDRVYPVIRTQDSDVPAVTVQRVDGNRQYSSEGPDGLVQSRVQVDVYGATYTETKPAARAVLAAVNGYRGTASGVEIQGVFVDGEFDDFASGSNSQGGQPERFFRTRIDFMVWHGE